MVLLKHYAVYVMPRMSLFHRQRFYLRFYVVIIAMNPDNNKFDEIFFVE